MAPGFAELLRAFDIGEMPGKERGRRSARISQVERDVWDALLAIVVRERRGDRPVGVGLGEQLLGFLLEGLDGVGAGGPAQRGLIAAASWISALASLAGSPPCNPFIFFQAVTVCLVFSA